MHYHPENDLINLFSISEMSQISIFCALTVQIMISISPCPLADLQPHVIILVEMWLLFPCVIFICLLAPEKSSSIISLLNTDLWWISLSFNLNPTSFSWFPTVLSPTLTPVFTHLYFTYFVVYFLFRRHIALYFISWNFWLFPWSTCMFSFDNLPIRFYTCSKFYTQLTGKNQHLLPHSVLDYLKKIPLLPLNTLLHTVLLLDVGCVAHYCSTTLTCKLICIFLNLCHY